MRFNAVQSIVNGATKLWHLIHHGKDSQYGAGVTFEPQMVGNEFTAVEGEAVPTIEYELGPCECTGNKVLSVDVNPLNPERLV